MRRRGTLRLREGLRDWAWRQGALHNLSPGAHRLLLWLAEQANLLDYTACYSQHDIARTLGVHPSGITRLRRGLEQRALVTTEEAVGVGLGRQLEWKLHYEHPDRPGENPGQ